MHFLGTFIYKFSMKIPVFAVDLAFLLTKIILVSISSDGFAQIDKNVGSISKSM